MIKKIITSCIILVAFGAGYGLALFKQSTLSGDSESQRAELSNHLAGGQDCAPTKNLSFKELLGDTRPVQKAVQPTQSKATPEPEQEWQYEQFDRLPEVDSVESLRVYLQEMSADNFDAERVIDFLNESGEGMALVIDQFTAETDPDRRLLMIDLISQSSHPEKIDFAQELVSSNKISERRAAYSWLAESDDNMTSRLALVEASFYEQDPGALVDLISAISVVGEDELAISRLNELSFHQNEDVATQSISVAASLSQDTKTLNTLTSHINGSNEALKLAALNGLYYFDGDDNSAALDAVAQLQNSPSESQEVRSLAGELVALWSQNGQDFDEVIRNGNSNDNSGGNYNDQDFEYNE